MWRERDRPALLGLTGVAAALYLLGQVALLLPDAGRQLVAPLDVLLSSTGLAIAMILGLLGHTCGRRLLAARRRGWLAPVWVTVGWGVPLLALLSLVSAAALLDNRLDPTDPASTHATVVSVRRVLSLTWNHWLTTHLLLARGDLSALYIFSVAAQLVGVATVAVVLLGRWPAALGWLALAVAVVAAAQRAATYDPETWLVESLSTVYYADLFLVGFAAALLAPRVRISRAVATFAFGALALALLAWMFATSWWSQQTQVQALAVLALLVGALCVCADHAPSDDALVVRGLSSALWQRWSAAWPYVLAWSYPVVVTIGRRSYGENRYLAAVVTLALIAVIVRLCVGLEDVLSGLGQRWRTRSRHRRRAA